MGRAWTWVKSHPYLTIGVIVFLVIVFIFVRRMAGGGGGGGTMLDGVPYSVVSPVSAGNQMVDNQAISAQLALENRRIDSQEALVTAQMAGQLELARLESADRRIANEQGFALQTQQIAASLQMAQTQSNMQLAAIQADLAARREDAQMARDMFAAQLAANSENSSRAYQLEQQRLRNERATANENRPRPILNFLAGLFGLR